MYYPPAYHEGIRLFNAGHFWHAHEQWEACWLATSGMEATFYKGIIQAAAALVKWQQGNRRGMQLNWTKSKARLATLPDHYMGLDVRAFSTTMEQFVTTHHRDPACAAPRFHLLDAFQN
jgi:uncharacterized protein